MPGELPKQVIMDLRESLPGLGVGAPRHGSEGGGATRRFFHLFYLVNRGKSSPWREIRRISPAEVIYQLSRKGDPGPFWGP